MVGCEKSLGDTIRSSEFLTFLSTIPSPIMPCTFPLDCLKNCMTSSQTVRFGMYHAPMKDFSPPRSTSFIYRSPGRVRWLGQVAIADEILGADASGIESLGR